jgi:hypothetical protein
LPLPFYSSIIFQANNFLYYYDYKFTMTKTSNQKISYASGIDPSLILEKKILVLDKPDRRFEKWGHLLRPILTTTTNNLVRKIDQRHWEHKGEFEDFLNKNTVFYPHEEVGDQTQKIIDTSLQKHKLRLVDEYDSHHKRSHYWEYVSDLRDNVIKGSSLKVDDVVQVGMIIRNGIQTDIALGVDFYTKRLSCSNGAISAARSEGNISISHVGSYEHMKERFLEAIPYAIEKSKEMIDYYQQSVYIKANQKLAEEFYSQLRNKITPKHFPENFNLDLDEIKKDPEKQNVSKVVNYKPKTEEKLWDVFNNFTENLWKSKKLSFTGKRKTETALHQVLVAHLPVF